MVRRRLTPLPRIASARVRNRVDVRTCTARRNFDNARSLIATVWVKSKEEEEEEEEKTKRKRRETIRKRKQENNMEERGTTKRTKKRERPLKPQQETRPGL